MEILAHAVTAELRHDRAAVGARVCIARRSDIAEEVPRPRRLDAEIHALFRHLDEMRSFRRRPAADDIHARRISIVAVEDRRDVDVHDIAFLQDRLLRRYAMADDIVDRNADTLGKAFVVQARRNSPVTGDIVVRRLVKRRRVNARLHHLSHEVERPIINDAALLDPLDVRFILDDAVRRTHLSAINVELHRA